MPKGERPHQSMSPVYRAAAAGIAVTPSGHLVSQSGVDQLVSQEFASYEFKF